MPEKPNIKIPEKPGTGGGERGYDPADRPQRPVPAAPAPTPQPKENK